VGEDLLVMGYDFIESGLQGVSFDAAFADELRALPGVLHVHGIRMSRIPFEGDRVLLFAYDADAPPEVGHAMFVEGGPGDREALARGEGVFVSEGFATRFGRGRGASVELPAPGGRIALPVLAVVEDYTWPRGSIWIDQRFYARAFADDEVQEFAITADGTRPLADLRADVEAAVRPRFAATVIETATLRRDVMRIIEKFWTLLLAQEGMAVTVAFLGSLHTLLISVLLRRREIALLRALGAPLSMLRSMLRIEGLLLGLAGGALGVLFGLAAGAIALRMLSLEEQGFAVPVRPSAWMALATLAAASFTGWIAGVIPGRRAARATPHSALLDTMA
jgi:putative ABC transport system permease protein